MEVVCPSLEIPCAGPIASEKCIIIVVSKQANSQMILVGLATQNAPGTCASHHSTDHAQIASKGHRS